jgi:hypothetical protein
MNRLDKKMLDTNEFKRIPLQSVKRALLRPSYYKIECLDCDLIISVRWERPYTGFLPTPTKKNLPAPICPFCEGEHIKEFKINEQDYYAINEQWDAVSVPETTQGISTLHFELSNDSIY